MAGRFVCWRLSDGVGDVQAKCGTPTGMDASSIALAFNGVSLSSDTATRSTHGELHGERWAWASLD